MKQLLPFIISLAFLSCDRTYTYEPPVYEGKAEDDSPKALSLKGKGLENVKLVKIAESSQQWTGVAVTKEGEIFVSYPRWSRSHRFSVARIVSSNEVKPFPNLDWNNWNASNEASETFINVQTVYVDQEGILWVLDTGNPFFEGIVKDGPKLLGFDPLTSELKKRFIFDKPVLKDNSYLNDIRIDNEKKIAYITDSGAGFILIVNLKNGNYWKKLEKHYSTKSENKVVKIGDKIWRRADGTLPSVHSDGIALSDDHETLFYQALTGKTLYSVPTKFLRNRKLPESQMEIFVEALDSVTLADGIIYGPGDNIYLTGIQEKAITRYTSAGEIELVIRDDRLKWPDTFAWGPDGSLYITTSQLHLENPDNPYFLLKVEFKE